MAGDTSPQTMPEQQAAISILIVDDEDYIVDLLAAMISREGYTVYTAYNGRQALAKMKSHLFDLIITDLMMPYADELLNILLSVDSTNTTPVWVLSAVETERLPNHVTHLPKPFEVDDVLNKIQQEIHPSK